MDRAKREADGASTPVSRQACGKERADPHHQQQACLARAEHSANARTRPSTAQGTSALAHLAWAVRQAQSVLSPPRTERNSETQSRQISHLALTLLNNSRVSEEASKQIKGNKQNGMKRQHVGNAAQAAPRDTEGTPC